MTQASTHFSPDELALLAGSGWIVPLERRETLPLDGPWLTVVLEGYLRVFRHAAFVRDVTLYLAGAGDGLGASRMFEERAVESGAEALVSSRVLRLTAEEFELHAGPRPEFYLKVAQTLGVRTRRVQEKLESYSHSGIEARVAAMLVELADDHGRPAAEGIRVELPLSQEDLARLAGTSRESCSSAVAELTRAGLIRGRRLRDLVVVDRAALGARAHV